MADNPTTATHDELLPRILAALALSRCSQTRFGFEVGGDPTLVAKMKQGRRILKSALRAAIEQRCAELEAEAAAKALED